MTYDGLLLTLLIVGIVLGLTPSIVAIFLALMAGSLGRGHSKNRVSANALGFLLGFLGATFALGMAWWYVMQSLSASGAQYAAIVIALLGITGGIVELKDYFWYGKGVSHRPHKRISALAHKHAVKKYRWINSLYLGFISLASAASTIGLSVLTIATLLYFVGAASPQAWLVVYGTALLFCVLVAAVLISSGTKVSAVLKWKEDSKPVMRLSSGFMTILLAWLLLLVVNTTLAVQAS